MFGMSLAKILLTAAVIWLVWMVARRIGGIARKGAARQTAADRARAAAESVTRSQANTPSQDAPQTLDLLACPSCGSFIAPGTTCQCGYRHPGSH